MEDRFSRTPLFILLSVAVFALLNYVFPLGARYVLRSPDENYIGPQGQFFLILWVLGLLLALVLLYVLCAWVFRRLAELTDSLALCRGVLVLGALCTAGHLLYGLWGSYGNGQALLLRLALTVAVLAICTTAITATRFGPEPEFDYSEYRA